MVRWQLQEAKARLSELVRQAKRKGPQAITIRGETEVVVLSREEYERLARPRPRFVELMRSSPLVGTKLRLTRDRSPARRVKL
jgi:prevent-host-death family protein